MVIRKHIHELLKLVLALFLRGSQEFLDDLEHGNDVSFLGFAEFRHKQDRRCQQTFCRVIEVGVLTEGSCIHTGQDDGFGNDLGVLLSLGFVDQLVGMGQVQVHILVDQMQKIVSMRPGGVAQIDDGNGVAIVLGDLTVVAYHITLGVR